MRFAALAVATLLLGASRDAGTVIPRKAQPGPRTQEQIKAQLEDEALDAIDTELADAGQPPPPFQWRLKNVVGSVEIPGIQESNGVPVKLHSLQIKSNLQDVLDDVLGQFKAQGLYVREFVEQAQPAAQTAVTGYDPVRQVSYTAMIECVKGRSCTVIIGEANIYLAAQNIKSRGAEQDFAPLPPSAIAVQRARTEQYQTITFGFATTPDEIRAFYASALERQGYQKSRRDVWSRPGDTIQLLFTTRDGRNIAMMTHAFAGLEESSPIQRPGSP